MHATSTEPKGRVCLHEECMWKELMAARPRALHAVAQVRDTIGDLPAIENGHDAEEMEYPGEPVRGPLHWP